MGVILLILVAYLVGMITPTLFRASIRLWQELRGDRLDILSKERIEMMIREDM